MSVLIRGEGVAGLCCAHLLTRCDIAVQVERTGRAKLPAVVIGQAAQKLICDTFGREDLFHGQPRIEKRIVKWGQAAKPLELPHSAVVISEDVLLERISDSVSGDSVEPDWTVFAGRPSPPNVEEHNFGSRTATASSVTLRACCDPGSCWIESLNEGWLFLISTVDCGWLLAAGAHRDALLSESSLVQEQLQAVGECSREFSAFPRLNWPLTRAQWLACGTAALAFDPICGEGAANAVREAILAAAVIQAAPDGRNAVPFTRHYQSRLLAGFERHLQICDGLYNTGQGPWWDRERESIRRGLAWCSGERGKLLPDRYRLHGFALEPLG